MAGFLYYLPGRTRDVEVADLRKAGLGHAFDDTCTACEVQTGPDGKAGVIVADDRRVPANLIKYKPDEQQWRGIPGSDIQVGMYTEDRPTPDDLERDQMLLGHMVRMGDGNDWLVPIARGYKEEDGELRWYVALPQVDELKDDGEWFAGEIVDPFKPLWNSAMRWWNAFCAAVGAETTQGEADGTTSFEFGELVQAVVMVLAANYLVGTAEIGLLKLSNGQCRPNVMNATIDLPTIIAWNKKKLAAAGSNSSDGLAA